MSRGKLLARLVDVDADPERDDAVTQLPENAADLATVEHDVVRPLDLRGERRGCFDGFGGGDRADERQLRRVELGRRVEHDRAEERRSRRRLPCVPVAPAPRGLEVGRSHGALRLAVEQELRRLALLDVRIRPSEASLDVSIDGLVRERVRHQAATGSTRTAEILYSGVPISGSPTSCVSQFTFAPSKWSAIQTRPG